MMMMNNTFYLRDELGPRAHFSEDPEEFRIESSWFVDKVNKLFETEKIKYLALWEVLNTHLTTVDNEELEFQKGGSLLSVDSGRLIKNRFKGFSEAFERMFEEHRNLCVVDPRLRDLLQAEVAKVFLPLYRRFFNKFSQIKFSKKHQEEYLKYQPQKVLAILDDLYIDDDDMDE